MHPKLSHQIAAFGLAAAVTLSVLLGLDLLATPYAASAGLAHAAAVAEQPAACS